MELLYAIVSTTVKLSLLAMFRTIFPKRWVSITTIVLAVISLVWCGAICLTGFLQCQPLSGMWDITQIETACAKSNRMAILLSTAIPNIVLDILILAIPLSEIFYLQLSWVKKLGVFVVFVLGGL